MRVLNKILYTKPSITHREEEYAADAVKNGWGDNAGYWINRFEEAVKKYLNVKYAIATSSCTGALHIGLQALMPEKKQKILLADTNWIATVAPVKYLHHIPEFLDIDQMTWCIDTRQVFKYLEKNKASAIIATHLYGNLCNMGELALAAKEHGCFIIEDAAEAFGAVYKGMMVGTMGDFGVFSFHGSKMVTTGEGGMLVTNDYDLYEKALALANHGRVPGEKRMFFPHMIGFKYKMSPVQAAIGCAQMERIDKLLSRKREIFHTYLKMLLGLPGLYMNYEKTGCINSFWMPTVALFKTENAREKLVKRFTEENIDARTFFYPLSSLPMFSQADNPVAYDLCARAVNLPSYYDMTDEDQKRVADVVIEVATEK